ncbi:hypothetical protein C0431_13460 [bacterium]|nr:hypothetical protein [bacterium]
MVSSIILAITLGNLPAERPAGIFTEQESTRLVAYWNSPDRYRSEDLNPSEPFQPVYSPAASAWLHQMYKQRDPGQPLIPTRLPVARQPRHKEWDTYIDTQYNQDYAWAMSVAAWMNADLSQSPNEGPVSRPITPTPADLKALASDPPPFFLVHRPQKITVSFDGFVAIYEEGVDVPRKYPFLRSATGVVSSSTPPTANELTVLARQAKLPEILHKPLLAVAQLEGGFDTINTYDTGGISIGIIQFASLTTGRGSLAQLLQNYRSSHPAEFSTNFRKYGIDVAPDGRLSVIDPTSGFENSGSDAVRVIVQDKRLTAVFQRAAKLSTNFRTAQIKLLARTYNPLALSVPVTLNGKSFSVPISQLFQTEAGIATLMDRLVNRGSIDPTSDVLSSLARENNITSVSELNSLERDAITRLAYRHDFLSVATLSQPTTETGPRRPANQIAGTPTGNPTQAGSIGRRNEIQRTPDESVAPFDPTQSGRVASNQPKPADPKAQPPAAVPKEPTPTAPAGPITIPGG